MLLKITIDEKAIGQRLDVYLANCLKGQYSRSQLQLYIKNSAVFIDDILVTITNFKIKAGKIISINIPQATESIMLPQKIALDILYEDEDILVLNKPSGLVVHPGAGNIQNTLVNALLYHCCDSLSGIGGVKRPGIVHRLDKNTSGIMVIAKHDAAHVNLSNQFADHGKIGALKRRYKAFIWGSLLPTKGVIETYLARSVKDRTKRSVVKPSFNGAKYAITNYKILKQYDLISLVECSLKTGRTHQIRVHMAHLGSPLLGDAEYGSVFNSKIKKLSPGLQAILANFNRQALHAYFLQFVHPSTNKLMMFEKDFPADMKAIFNYLEQNNL